MKPAEYYKGYIDRMEFPYIMRSVNTDFGADVEYYYLCPLCNARAMTLDNLQWEHTDDCPRSPNAKDDVS
jgi:hypothetical protein